MQFWFERTADGRVTAKVDKGLAFLQTVLDDGLALARGWPLEDGPQTADITRAQALLEYGVRVGRDQEICGGNMSFLELRDGLVFADIDYDEPELSRGDWVRPAEVIDVLQAYRREVVAVWVEQLHASGRQLLPSSRPPS